MANGGLKDELDKAPAKIKEMTDIISNMGKAGKLKSGAKAWDDYDDSNKMKSK